MNKKPLVCKEVLNAKLQKEINTNKVDIDKSAFSKTEEEKALLKQLKKSVTTNSKERASTFFGQIKGKRRLRCGSLRIKVD